MYCRAGRIKTKDLNDIINGNIYNLMNNGDIRNKSSVYYKNAWFANNPTGTFTGPGPISWSGYMWAASNSEMVEDGSFLKMNNLAITCHLPKKILNVWQEKTSDLPWNQIRDRDLSTIILRYLEKQRYVYWNYGAIA